MLSARVDILPDILRAAWTKEEEEVLDPFDKADTFLLFSFATLSSFSCEFADALALAENRKVFVFPPSATNLHSLKEEKLHFLTGLGLEELGLCCWLMLFLLFLLKCC